MKQILYRVLSVPETSHALSFFICDNKRKYRLELRLVSGESRVYHFEGDSNDAPTKRFIEFGGSPRPVEVVVSVVTGDPSDCAEKIKQCEIHFVEELARPHAKAKRQYWRIKSLQFEGEDAVNTESCVVNDLWQKPTFDGYPGLSDFVAEGPALGFMLVDPTREGHPASLAWEPEAEEFPSLKNGFPGFQFFRRDRGLRVDECVFEVWYKRTCLAEDEEPPLDFSIRLTFQKVWD